MEDVVLLVIVSNLHIGAQGEGAAICRQQFVDDL